MKIFTSAQIHELDKFTIENEPVKSIDLMERSAKAITQAITEVWGSQTPVIIFAGPGNNGGDALAVGRMLCDKGYDVCAYLFNVSGHLSEDCVINRKRLFDKKSKALIEVTQEFEPPQLDAGTLVVDGLFGSGLNKPLAGGFASLVKYINASPAQVVSIDIPSGLMTEDNTYNVRTNIIRANLTLTLQLPKLSFLFPENQMYIGRLKVLDIRLSKQGIDKIDANYTLIEENDIRPRLLHRDPFAHKGKMGNALIIAGSYGMGGASVLATKACLRAGAGKVTTHTPKRNSMLLQISVPEAIIQFDREETIFSEAVDTEDFNAVGIGPGLGTSEQTAIAIIAQLRRTQCPVVADADAINVIANHRAWLQQLPKGIIMTPHPKEFQRLHGYILVKGHHTSLCLPDGHIMFNSTGNAGMATAGSGDVLTGIITGLLARGYKHEDACVVGMYLHGLAGDIAARELGIESVIASDLIKYIPQAFKRINE